MASMLDELERKLHHQQPRKAVRKAVRDAPRMTAAEVRLDLSTWWSFDNAVSLAHLDVRRTGQRQQVRRVEVVPDSPEPWRVRAWQVTPLVEVAEPCS